MHSFWQLKHDYADKLPAIFYHKQHPEPPANGTLRLFNEELAAAIGMDVAFLRAHPGFFTGGEVPEGAEPIAQAYSGHQFGHFTRLGDGRALLLGEWELADGNLLDIQWKGSGRTPYSRGGDGKAALGPMLREYVISEFMVGLGIPTTRALAVAETGETIRRETPLPGAVLTRVAKSHIRVGTFQYAAEVGGTEAVLALLRYAMERHDPELLSGEKPILSFLRAVSERQAHLTAEWMRVGFVHGVMNTDNMAISGETIDYGPCAFMDRYDPGTVFSSIDWQRRYAFGRQPLIAQWNLARLAEALLGAIRETGEGDTEEAQEIVASFGDAFQTAYRRAMAAKLGIGTPLEEDDALIEEFLQILDATESDYTNGFLALQKEENRTEWAGHSGFMDWNEKWRHRLDREGTSRETAAARMQTANPFVIPRNHIVEKALQRATEDDDWSGIHELLRLGRRPYAEQDIDPAYREPMPDAQRRGYRTFCGT